jgi:DNA-binding transcriptional LysR family regulator
MNGEGPAVLSALSVTAELGDGRLRAVELEGTVLHRPFRAVWHPERPPTGAAAALLAAAGRSTPAPGPD